MTRLSRVSRNYASFFGGVVFIALASTLIFRAAAVREAVILGIKLSATTVLPAIFPFFILSDYTAKTIPTEQKGFFGRIFESLFGISGAATRAFILGTVCGFPIGAKASAELYESGTITKDELEGLLGIVNNPSLAFVISGIGLGMIGSLAAGIILYVSVILSAVSVGMIFKKKYNKTEKTRVISRQSFDLAESIKNAGFSSIAISSYIIFFSAVLGLISAPTDSMVLTPILASLLEIGNASSIIAKSKLSTVGSFCLLGFALGFSGLSVHLQVISFLPKDISKKKYFLMKCLQGLFSAIFSVVLFFIFGVSRTL